MDIRFYNTLTHATESFSSIEPHDVYMYNCGPTVYDYAHIGNFRAFVFADVLRRFLELTGHRVHQVMNLTDVGHMTDDAQADGAGQDKMQVAIDRMKTAKKSGRVPDTAVTDPCPLPFREGAGGGSGARDLRGFHPWPNLSPQGERNFETASSIYAVSTDAGAR